MFGLTFEQVKAMSSDQIADEILHSDEMQRGYSDGHMDALFDDDQILSEKDACEQATIRKQQEGNHPDYLKGYWVGQVSFG